MSAQRPSEDRHGDSHHHGDEVLTPLREVQELVLAGVKHLQTIEVPVEQAIGYCLAADVVVEADLPPFANSAMDGYAVKAADTEASPSTLAVAGLVAAGDPPPSEVLAAGQAVQIMTGAPMPPGADAVAIVELSRRLDDDRVVLSYSVSRGENVRPAGSDFHAGETALTRGTLVGPAQLAVCLSAGAQTLEVCRRPRVGVMSTGDELVAVGTELAPGQIRDSNRLMLAALVERDGFEAIDLGIVRDTRQDVRTAMERALSECDAVLSSGGVSKGAFDYVKVVLGELATERGGEFFELAVAIRPAKPLALAFFSGEEPELPVVFFGLPGNPVSSMVSYQVIALPGLKKMAGRVKPLTSTVAATAAEELRAGSDGRLNLVRVEAAFGPDGRLLVRSAGGQQSHQLSGTLAANAIALVPSGETVAVGATVEVLLTGAVG